MNTKFCDGQRCELIRTEPGKRLDGSETTFSVRRSESADAADIERTVDLNIAERQCEGPMLDAALEYAQR